MPKILIDADGCPVVDETIEIGEAYGIEVILVADTSHVFSYEDISVIVADKGRDRTDFILLQNVEKDDIVITQDYGLAALVLSRKAHPVSHNGFLYTEDNMDDFLASRYMGSLMRKHKNHGPHMRKRTREDDERFIATLESLLESLLEE